MLLSLAIFTTTLSCGTNQQEQEQSLSQTESAGSWSTMVGGSMLKWQQTFFQEVKSVTFYKVYMPVGLGVVHEYIGVKAMMTNGSTKLSTSGLVGDADAAYFKNTLPIPVRSKQYVPAFARSMLKD